MAVTLSIKISSELRKRLGTVARERQTTPSALVRQALFAVIESKVATGSCFELTEDLFEDLGSGPADLSTNPSHLDDFGH